MSSGFKLKDNSSSGDGVCVAPKHGAKREHRAKGMGSIFLKCPKIVTCYSFFKPKIFTKCLSKRRQISHFPYIRVEEQAKKCQLAYLLKIHFYVIFFCMLRKSHKKFLFFELAIELALLLLLLQHLCTCIALGMTAHDVLIKKIKPLYYARSIRERYEHRDAKS